jgi:hypothetical protein
MLGETVATELGAPPSPATWAPAPALPGAGHDAALEAEAKEIKAEVVRRLAEQYAPEPEPEPELLLDPPGSPMDKALSFRSERTQTADEIAELRREGEREDARLAALSLEEAEEAALVAQIEAEIAAERTKRLTEARAGRKGLRYLAASKIQARYRGGKERRRGPVDRAAARIQARQRGRIARRTGNSEQLEGVGGRLDSDWARRFLGKLGPNGNRATRVRRHAAPSREWLREQMLPALREVLQQTAPGGTAPMADGGVRASGFSWDGGGGGLLNPQSEESPVLHVTRALRRMIDPDAGGPPS